MRFSVVAIVAAVVAVASAQELNPLYPFKPNGGCIQKCLDDAGNNMLPGKWTSDPSQPGFLESLGFAHDRGTPKYSSYMSATGLCIATKECPKPEQDLYRAQYEAKLAWYLDAKAKAAAVKNAAAGSAAVSGFMGAAALVAAAALF
ncbi:hypothetical protein BG006_002036 [Podila minutissima]|uniref:Secreted protein n=1 Tax=Podila minutissima TaxID=64525 RepID=A0A9P5S9P7_9FUNG|nr:hypothetical protein BG006_002036 [Podila minutissima]